MATATYIPIATQTLGSAVSNITFSSIPNTYTDLRLVLTCVTSIGGNILLTFNGDTGNNYSRTFLFGTGSSAISSYQTSATSFRVDNAPSTTYPCVYNFDMFSYAGSTYKTILYNDSEDANGSGQVARSVGLWKSTSAINSLAFNLSGGTFNVGTTATLWGI